MNGTTIQIRGYHCDAYGHVNNARYLELLEEARWTFLQPALEEKFFDARNLLFIVVNINISYKKPLTPNQIVDIEIVDVKYKNKSMVVKQTITVRDSKVLSSEADVTFVLLDSKTGKPVAITEEIIAKFDRTQLIRVVTNLIKNGIQAIPEDKTPHIVVKVLEENDEVIITVSDNGVGITEENKLLKTSA